MNPKYVQNEIITKSIFSVFKIIFQLQQKFSELQGSSCLCLFFIVGL